MNLKIFESWDHFILVKELKTRAFIYVSYQYCGWVSGSTACASGAWPASLGSVGGGRAGDLTAAGKSVGVPVASDSSVSQRNRSVENRV